MEDRLATDKSVHIRPGEVVRHAVGREKAKEAKAEKMRHALMSEAEMDMAGDTESEQADEIKHALATAAETLSANDQVGDDLQGQGRVVQLLSKRGHHGDNATGDNDVASLTPAMGGVRWAHPRHGADSSRSGKKKKKTWHWR